MTYDLSSPIGPASRLPTRARARLALADASRDGLTMDSYLDDLRGERFVTTSSTLTESERMRLARGVGTEWVRIRRGVYVRADDAAPAGTDAAFLDLVRAHSIGRHLVFSGSSAAALWRLPLVRGWPSRVEAVAAAAAGGRSRSGLMIHTLGQPESVHLIEGIAVTSLATTAVEVARTRGFDAGVVAIDAALHGYRLDSRLVKATRAECAVALDVIRGLPGSMDAQRALDFADERSESPAEGLTRVGFARLGLPPPELQCIFTDALGEMRTDFGWRDRRLVWEVDGIAKYIREDDGRTPAEIVVDEKMREDRLRRLGVGVGRSGWVEALEPKLLRPLVRAHGFRV